MSHTKIHFSFEPGKPDIDMFAQNFIAKFGQNDFKEADTIVTIGGDGSLLHAFCQAAAGQKFFGLVPPASNSRGFWTNHGIQTPDDLDNALKTANTHSIHPLKSELVFADKSTRVFHAFNEVAPSENSGQAMLANLTLHFPNVTKGPIRIMGDGLIIATPFGSTAMNRTYGGASIDIRNTGIAVTGKGIYDPIGFPAIVAEDNTHFEIEFLSPRKRPARIQYDGKKITSEMTNPFNRLLVSKDRNNSVELMLMEDPATRAFSALL